MVILIATEDTLQLTGLASLLKQSEVHRVLTAARLEEVEQHGSAEDSLDLLLCARHFSTTDGAAVQEAMASKFPGLHTGFLNAGPDPGFLPAEGDRCFAPETPLPEIQTWVESLAGQHLTAATTSESKSPLPETLLGVTLGDYQILEKRRDLEKSQSYLARQISMHRKVVLERMKPECQHDPTAKRQFRALVRSMANVAHPSIAAVYEAQETAAGEIFYTRELVQGRSVPEMLEAGVKLSQEEALQLLRVTGEGMGFYASREITRGPLEPKHVFLGQDGMPRLANLATVSREQALDERSELAQLARALQGLCPLTAHGRETEIAVLFNRMKGRGNAPVQDWAGLVRSSKKLLQHIASLRASQPIPQSPQTALLQRTSQRALVPLLLVFLALGIVATAVALLYPGLSKSAPRKLDAMVKIPAGPSVFGVGESVALPDFWIDQYEVTISQYAEFLTTVSISEHRYDHPHQPSTKLSHEPEHWQEYYPAAMEGGTYKGHAITLNTPVLWADWWDAYAYARWRGHRLPTEQQWEKAARGVSGAPWPWGASPEPARANTGADFSATAGGGGAIDGFASWCDVDAKSQDVSEAGVCGMAGNVAEWTDTWAQHPDLPDQQSPVYRGGNFSQKNAPIPDQRWIAKTPELTQPFLGFRTVSDHPPQP